MAIKPLRPCRKPGCFALVQDGYCSAHKPKTQRMESASWHSWYSQSIWVDDLRPNQLLQEPFCRECSRQGFRTYATDVDHIVDHKGSWALFTDRSNLQSLCHRCHSRKTMQERWKQRKN